MRAGRVAVGGLFVALLLCVTEVGVADAGGRVWHRELRGSGLGAVTVDAARHIFVTGSARARPVMPGTKAHVRAMLVAKYGPAGGLAWRRTWRRGGLWFAYGATVVRAPRGGVYVAGHSGRYEGWSAGSSGDVLNALAGTSADNVWAVGYANDGASSAVVMRWSGAAWRVQPTPILTAETALYGVDASSSTNVWAVGFQRSGTQLTYALHCC